MHWPTAFLLAPAIVAGLALDGPAIAQTPFEPPPADAPSDPLSSGLEGLMGKLLNQMQPHLEQLGRDLNDTVNSVSPIFSDLGKLMDDAGNYEAPERLENGDILIRRRADAPPPPEIGQSLRDLLAPGPTPPEPPPEPKSTPDIPFSIPSPESSGEIEL